MAPALNVGVAIGAFAVADGQVDDLEIVFRRAEDEIEIAEGIEIAEVGAIARRSLRSAPAEHFGPAERVLDTLTQQPGKRQAEEFVAEEIEEAHRAVLHRDTPGGRH